MCWDTARTYPGSQRAPSLARRFCADQLMTQLADRPDRRAIIDDAVVIVSELVTNAVRAGCTSAQVSLTMHHRQLRVAVDDDAPGMPSPRQPTDRDPRGRGLAIAAELSSAWGTENTATGKRVWAELDLSPALTTALTCHSLQTLGHGSTRRTL